MHIEAVAAESGGSFRVVMLDITERHHRATSPSDICEALARPFVIDDAVGGGIETVEQRDMHAKHTFKSPDCTWESSVRWRTERRLSNADNSP